MGEILFLAHRMPFPPDRGDKIRSHHLLLHLAARAPVHVGCFADTPADLAAEPELRAVAASHCLLERTKALPVAGVEALLSRKPISLTAFASGELRDWVRHVLVTRPIETIFVFSGQMGQYIPEEFAGRVIIDLCDVDSAKFDAYGKPLHKWIDRREGRLLASEEKRLAIRADHTLLVSENEAELLRSRVGNIDARISAVRNGIDTGVFAPQAVTSHGDLSRSMPHLVFTGQMDYPPNIAACERVIRAILPKIRVAHSDAQFHVVGRAPTREILKYDGKNGVRIWGEVPDVRPFLAGADVVLAPLTIARGIQNKVLEAMAMARPVVLSPQAATGIDAADGEHFSIGGNDEQLARNILKLLDDGPRALKMGAAARRFVMEQQGWDAMLAPLDALLSLTKRDRDAA